MLQPTSNPRGLLTDFDHHAGLFPAQISAQSADRPAAGRQTRVTSHVIRQVVVLEVAGRLGDVVQDLDRAIELALADGPRGVVCDLSAVLEGVQPCVVEVLASAGRHVRDWPGIPVAVACPDPRFRAELAAHPLGGHLIVTATLLPALHAVLATPPPVVEWLRLAPHPTAPRASRDFVTRTLLDWGLGRLILSASMVVNELVTNSTMHAGTDIDLSVAWSLGALRLTVRDSSGDLSRQRYSRFDLNGRWLCVVAALCPAFGVLPTGGGKVVWAVLNAVRPRPSTSPRRPEPATALQDSPIFNNAPSSAGLSLCASSGPYPTERSTPATPGGDNTPAW
jgi:hypothetical protein